MSGNPASCQEAFRNHLESGSSFHKHSSHFQSPPLQAYVVKLDFTISNNQRAIARGTLVPMAVLKICLKYLSLKLKTLFSKTNNNPSITKFLQNLGLIVSGCLSIQYEIASMPYSCGMFVYKLQMLSIQYIQY